MKFISILIIIIGFSNCSILKLENKTPFKITGAFYKNWVGGQPGIKGTNVIIQYKINTPFKFDSIYFRKKVTKLQTKKNIDKMVIGYFNTSTIQSDIILNSNPVKELHNPIPEINNFPFELKMNEAVISFTINGEIKYYKIELQEKAQSISFPYPQK